MDDFAVDFADDFAVDFAVDFLPCYPEALQLLLLGLVVVDRGVFHGPVQMLLLVEHGRANLLGAKSDDEVEGFEHLHCCVAEDVGIDGLRYMTLRRGL